MEIDLVGGGGRGGGDKVWGIRVRVRCGGGDFVCVSDVSCISYGNSISTNLHLL